MRTTTPYPIGKSDIIAINSDAELDVMTDRLMDFGVRITGTLRRSATKLNKVRLMGRAAMRRYIYLYARQENGMMDAAFNPRNQE